MLEKNQPEKVEKRKMQVTQQVFHNLAEIIELYPKYSICQHFAAILRRKSTTGQEFFHWTNDALLKRLEQHKEELEGEELLNLTEEDDNY